MRATDSKYPLSGVRRAKASSDNSTTSDNPIAEDDGDANVSTTLIVSMTSCRGSPVNDNQAHLFQVMDILFTVYYIFETPLQVSSCEVA